MAMYSFEKSTPDGDDVIMEPSVRYKCRSLEHLMRMTKFSKHEMRMLYQGFKQECPSGVVTEQVFKEIFDRFFPQGDSSKYAHLVFQKVTNGQNLTFEEFVTTLSRLSRGSVDEKIKWMFELYDVNGCGYIRQEEMSLVVNSIFDLLPDSSTTRTSLSSDPQSRVQHLFQDDNRLKNLQNFDTLFL